MGGATGLIYRVLGSVLLVRLLVSLASGIGPALVGPGGTSSWVVPWLLRLLGVAG